MTIKEVEDLCVGLEFYIEDYSRYGNDYCVSEDVRARFLCEFYGCTLVEACTYDDKIDMYSARERRCGSDYHKYIDKIQEHLNSDFVRKLKAYYDDEQIFEAQSVNDDLTADEIMARYGINGELITSTGNETFDKMLATLEDNINSILNPTSPICTEYEGCYFQDVCDRNTSTCSIALQIQKKPLPPACQELVDFDEQRAEKQWYIDNKAWLEEE